MDNPCLFCVGDFHLQDLGSLDSVSDDGFPKTRTGELTCLVYSFLKFAIGLPSGELT